MCADTTRSNAACKGVKDYWLKTVVGVVIGLMGWGGSIIYDNLKQTVQDNRASIQALISIHLNGE